jgi:hypothetical protein
VWASFARKHRGVGIAGAIALAMLTACADSTPIELSAQFTPQNRLSWSSPATTVCRIHFSEIRDARADPRSMGAIETRLVLAADAAGWLRSGLQSLSRDPRVKFVDDKARGEPDLDLSVELVKAYAIAISSDKSISVVIHVRYGRGGSTLGENSYRGVYTGTIWGPGPSEIQSAFDDALGQIVQALDRDILARCAPVTAGAH